MGTRASYYGLCNPQSAFESPTFDLNAHIPVNHTVGAASISPCGRDVALASREGLHIVDLDNLHARPRHLIHRSPWDVADVQWSPFASRYYWIVSTSNQKALVWNLEMKTNRAPIQFTLHAHSRAITDINFSAHHPDILSTCAVDSYVHCWDLRTPSKPAFTFADWNSGATQVKWNRQEPHIVASAHDRYLHIWDDRKGTFPLKTIEAHQTKIYGIDWSRATATGIITCSLDHTIKIWSYDKDVTEPDRVIYTDYPVWRARHTPFGHGVLAMPQRGNSQLQLFNQNRDPSEPIEGRIEPAASFRGHHDQVKEFLWRPRGSVETGFDNRDFQLVSLGLDHRLVLHKVTDKHLTQVGHVKGMPVVQSLKFTRRGAKYRTFRGTDNLNRPVPAGLKPTVASSASTTTSIPILTPSLTGIEPPVKSTQYDRLSRTYRPSLGSNPAIPKKIHELMHSKAHGTSLPSFAFSPTDLLQEEVGAAKRKFPEVLFSKTNFRKRSITFTLLCRWDRTHKPALMKVKIRFPISYPRIKGPDFVFKKLPVAMSNAALIKLHRDLDTIAEHYRCRRVGSLEASVFFLLGKRTLTESINGSSHITSSIDSFYDDVSCSDNDFEGGNRLSKSNTRADRKSRSKQAPTIDPPPLRTCAARWTPDGQLVCLFVRHQGPEASFSTKWADIFDRRQSQSQTPGETPTNAADGEISEYIDEDDTDSDDSTHLSSADSSDIDDLVNVNTKLFLLSPWRNEVNRASLMCERTGQPLDQCTDSGHNHTNDHAQGNGSGNGNGGNGGSGVGRIRPRNVSVLQTYDVAGLLPGSRALAQGYLVFGDSSSVCKHNSRVALEQGLVDIAASWNLADLAIQSQIPLDWLYNSGGGGNEPGNRNQGGQYQYLGQKFASNRVGQVNKRFDDNMISGSGNDGYYSILNLGSTGLGTTASTLSLSRINLDGHLLSRPWVVDQLFNHYERVADIQMLAMLSCVFIGSNFPVHRDVVNGLGLTFGKSGFNTHPSAAVNPFGTVSSRMGDGWASGVTRSPVGSMVDGGGAKGGGSSPSPARFLTPKRSLALVSSSRVNAIVGQDPTLGISGSTKYGGSGGGISSGVQSEVTSPVGTGPMSSISFLPFRPPGRAAGALFSVPSTSSVASTSTVSAASTIGNNGLTRPSSGSVTWGGVQVFGDSDSSSTATQQRLRQNRNRARPSIISRMGGTAAGDGNFNLYGSGPDSGTAAGTGLLSALNVGMMAPASVGVGATVATAVGQAKLSSLAPLEMTRAVSIASSVLSTAAGVSSRSAGGSLSRAVGAAAATNSSSSTSTTSRPPNSTRNGTVATAAPRVIINPDESQSQARSRSRSSRPFHNYLTGTSTSPPSPRRSSSSSSSDCPNPHVMLKNQERFDNGGFCGTSLLDHQLIDRAFTYRDLYASMLEAWSLSRPSGEVLSFNRDGTTTTTTTGTGPASGVGLSRPGTALGSQISRGKRGVTGSGTGGGGGPRAGGGGSTAIGDRPGAATGNLFGTKTSTSSHWMSNR